mmetsp:Transcript_66837/g.216029  ORF Transcript_66837/g.216029 Transcript_66837/m.216029 type:complete len:234 (+) Transcript_66837:330-1031(+)
MLSLLPETFFVNAGTLCSAFFFLSPCVQMMQVHKSSGASLSGVNPQTLILMFFNCALWTIWGVFLPMPPAVPGNLLGLVASSFYLLFCWSHVLRGAAAPTWNRLTALATAVAVLLNFSMTGYAMASTQAAENVGRLAMLICICMFAAPLSTLGQVLKEKSSELLPPAQCTMQFCNCLLWTVVGVNQKSMPILVCNALGLVLGAVQLGLMAVFPSGKSEQLEAKKHDAKMSDFK